MALVRAAGVGGAFSTANLTRTSKDLLAALFAPPKRKRNKKKKRKKKEN